MPLRLRSEGLVGIRPRRLHLGRPRLSCGLQRLRVRRVAQPAGLRQLGKLLRQRVLAQPAPRRRRRLALARCRPRGLESLRGLLLLRPLRLQGLLRARLGECVIVQ
jgi:hypothetical protein